MSMTNKPLLSISLLVLTLGLSTFASAQSASIGVNAAVKGDVTVTTVDQIAKQAVVKEEVYLGQMINSKKVSSLQILLKDKTVFTVGPECELTIDKFVYDPNKANNSMVANVSKGMFRFMSGNISNSGADAVSINTPTSSMGIRGTMVEGLVGANAIQIAQGAGIIPAGTALDATGATLFVLRGPGQNTTGMNRKGEITVTSGDHTVIVKGSNRAVFVPSAGAAPIVFSLSPIAFQNFSQNLRTTPTGPATYGRFEIDSHFKAKAQPGSASAQGGNGAAGAGGASASGGIGASTIVFGLGAIGGIGAVIANNNNDEEPSSP